MPAPLLLTPGPLTTHPATRQALTEDHGSRGGAFAELSDELRRRLLDVAGLDPAEWAAVPLQGSGTYAVEAAIGTLVPKAAGLLVCVNGAYGRRMVQIARVLGRAVSVLEFPEDAAVDATILSEALDEDEGLTHVAVVHCETTTGLLNPMGLIAEVVAARGRSLLVDAMSAYGAIPCPAPFDALIASSNKCIEGIPGFGFVFARKARLSACRGNSHSVVLDLADQQAFFERSGQWRFTPPTHVVAGTVTALRLHAEEGGTEGRGARYRENLGVLVHGMRALGFRTYLPDAVQAPTIVTFLKPAALPFERFYEGLLARGFAIYPGKLTEVDSFRVGCIGQVFPDDLRRFLGAVREVLAELEA